LGTGAVGGLVSAGAGEGVWARRRAGGAAAARRWRKSGGVGVGFCGKS